MKMNYQFNFGFHAFSVPSAVVDNFLRVATETQLKVLLCLLRYPDNPPDAAQTASFLKIPQEQAEEAIEFWTNFNILLEKNDSGQNQLSFDFFASAPEQKSSSAPMSSPEPEQKPSSAPEPAPPAKKLKEYDSRQELMKLSNADIVRMAEQSPDIMKLVRESKKYYLRDQNPTELRSLVWMYEYLGFPVKVILMMMDCCQQLGTFDPRHLEKMAAKWWERGIMTVPEAEKKVKELLDSYTYQSYLCRIFELQEKPTQSQKKFMKQWQEAAYPEELLRYARDLCVESKSKIKFDYMDAILKNWSENNITTVAEAEAARKAYLEKLSYFGISGKISPAAEEQIQHWLSIFSEEMIEYARKLSIENTGKETVTFSYLKKIFTDWEKANVRTIEQARTSDGKKGRKKKEVKDVILEQEREELGKYLKLVNRFDDADDIYVKEDDDES